MRLRFVTVQGLRPGTMDGIVRSRGGSPTGVGRCVSGKIVYAQHMATMISKGVDLVEYYSASHYEI